MTTDHDLIARACRLVGIWYSGTRAEWKESEHYYGQDDNPALYALLVWRLAKALAARPYAWSEGDTEPTCIVLSTGGHGWCIWREMCDGSQELGPDNENPGELKEPIDIIRVLVDALEEGE